MEEFYLPEHLITPFFQNKQIEFRFEDEEGFRTGHLQTTVFANRACRISILYPVSNVGTCSIVEIPLHSDMLDRVCWDPTNQLFRATFDKKSKYLQD